MKNDFNDFSGLDAMKAHPVSGQIDQLFKTVIKEQKKSETKLFEEVASVDDKALKLDDVEFDINLGEVEASAESPLDEGLDLGLSDDQSLDIIDGQSPDENDGNDGGYGDIALGDDESLSLDDEEPSEEVQEDEVLENLGELSFADTSDESPSLPPSEDSGLTLGEEDLMNLGELSFDDSSGLEQSSKDEISTLLKLDADSIDQGFDLGLGEGDLSDDAKEKLKEIDAIMEIDASQINIRPNLSSSSRNDGNLDEPLVSEDLDLGRLNFSTELDEQEVVGAPVKEEKMKKKKKDSDYSPSRDRDLGNDLRELSGAYSGEMERMQATISNLRSDREELLAKIQKLEEDRTIQNRSGLTMRAELDEKKIELMIIRKKLNEEINDLKDRLKLYDEKRLILEEKNRILMQELDKVSQKNKMDVKKVQMRERELEQKLELLKSDAETQIRNRDLKILELKRKIDAMEFDMESISQQEKRSVESRYELEDKLEKAIKTLRGAITVLEDESDRTSALNALKKNIDM